MITLLQAIPYEYCLQGIAGDYPILATIYMITRLWVLTDYNPAVGIIADDTLSAETADYQLL